MANFNKVYERLKVNEGGYVNDPDDRGGETYLGISRKYHKDAAFWTIIDEYKKNNGTKNINSYLKDNKIVQNEIKSIYKKEYWDVFKLDNCPSQGLASEIFDDAVNRGVSAACKILCDTIGISRVSYPDDRLFNIIANYGKK